MHNLNSIKELKDKFDIIPEKVKYHPFPLMDLTKMLPKTVKKYETVDFLFIGHLRKAKGIELLLEVWKEFHLNNPCARLRICGKLLDGIIIDKIDLEKQGVEFNLDFISDDDYYYVKATRYVILPYIVGTNSGPVMTHNDFSYQMPEFEAIKPGITGDFFTRDNVESMAECVEQWFIAKTGKREDIRQSCFKEIDEYWTPEYQIQVLKENLK